MIRGFYPIVVVVLVFAVVGVGGHRLLSNEPQSAAEFSLTDFLSSGEVDTDDRLFTKAESGYVLRFPRDHIAHPAFRSEWWYINGNLQHRDDAQQRFGFQFTVFRQALQTQKRTQQQATSGWLTPQFYMGHAGLGVFSQNRHLVAERFSRQGPGLAGTSSQPLSVWLENWQLRSENDQDLFPAQLKVGVQHNDAGESFSYRLRLIPEKPRVYQGDQGYSPKRPEPGFASYYYSYTRLRVEGEIRFDDQTIPVTGAAWYDHEWASNSLAAYQSGWDWFSLQFKDGRELMFMVLRSKAESGQADFRQVSLFSQSGERLPLDARNITLDVLDHWQSETGVIWPSGWRMKIPEYDLDLRILPRQKKQENNLSVRYWEGAVSVEGSHVGQGYVELTGYE